MISVVVCDDVPELRRLLREALSEGDDMEVVGEASDGREAIEVIERLQPDVVILDLSMPELDGLEAIPLIHQVAPAAEICIFSGFEGVVHPDFPADEGDENEEPLFGRGTSTKARERSEPFRRGDSRGTREGGSRPPETKCATPLRE